MYALVAAGGELRGGDRGRGEERKVEGREFGRLLLENVGLKYGCVVIGDGTAMFAIAVIEAGKQMCCGSFCLMSFARLPFEV